MGPGFSSIYLPYLSISPFSICPLSLLSSMFRTSWINLSPIKPLNGSHLSTPANQRPNSWTSLGQKSLEFSSLLFTVTSTNGFYPPPPSPPAKIVYRNLKSENSQDYAQKPQHNCMFMNSASAVSRSNVYWRQTNTLINFSLVYIYCTCCTVHSLANILFYKLNGAVSTRPRPMCPRKKVIGRSVPWTMCSLPIPNIGAEVMMGKDRSVGTVEARGRGFWCGLSIWVLRQNVA